MTNEFWFISWQLQEFLLFLIGTRFDARLSGIHTVYQLPVFGKVCQMEAEIELKWSSSSCKVPLIIDRSQPSFGHL